jgi:hypothetical protein
MSPVLSADLRKAATCEAGRRTFFPASPQRQAEKALPYEVFATTSFAAPPSDLGMASPFGDGLISGGYASYSRRSLE